MTAQATKPIELGRRARRAFLALAALSVVAVSVVLGVRYVRTRGLDRARRLALTYEEAKSRDDLEKMRNVSRTIDSLGEDALPVLEAMYRSEHPDPRLRTFMRVQATQRLQKIRSRRATSILVERLKDEDEQVRYAALTTLGYRADTVALGAVLAAYKRARSVSEKIAGAVSLGTLYRHSDPRPQHVFDLFVEIVKGGPSIAAKRAALDGLEFSVAPGEATQAERAAIPAVLDVIERIPELAPDAYGVIYVLTGRDFAGLHTSSQAELHDWMVNPVQAEQSGFADAYIRIESLAEEGELRVRVVTEVKAWMKEKGIPSGGSAK